MQETKVDEKRFKSDLLPGYEAHFYSCKTNPGYSGAYHSYCLRMMLMRHVQARHCSRSSSPSVSPRASVSQCTRHVTTALTTERAGIEDHDDEGRCITAEFDTFYVVNTYIPNAGLKLKEYVAHSS